MADELCIVRSLHSEIPAHGPGAKFMITGSAVLTRPSLGSWLLYGLGIGGGMFHEAIGFQTFRNPIPSKSFTFAVANSVTPCAVMVRAERAS